MQHSAYSKILATIILVLLGILLLIAIFPYKNAFFGAFILYVLFYPAFSWLQKKGISKEKSAWLVIISTLFIILLPLILILPSAISQVGDIIENQDTILGVVDALDARIPNYDLTGSIKTTMREGLDYFQTQLGSFIGGATDFFITFVIMYFLLYYLFVNTVKKSKLKNFIPFSRKHKQMLVDEFSQISKATIFTTGIIAVFQGALLGIGLWLVGVPGSLFLGFAAAILSFIPIVGIPVIWIPAGLFLLATQHWASAIFIFVLGVILSNADNFIRPFLQKKIGRIHPLTSLIGVFIGLPLFGIIGIVIGPLLISYFFLILDMYLKEYVEKDD